MAAEFQREPGKPVPCASDQRNCEEVTDTATPDGRHVLTLPEIKALAEPC